MIRFIVRRILSAALVMVVVSAVTFVLLEMAPGDAARTRVGPDASAEEIAEMRQALGLDDPLPVRYARFAAGLLRGDLGTSLVSERPVAGLLTMRFGKTLQLALSAVALATVAGVLTGMLAASRPGSRLDATLMTGIALGQALPTFWLALLLIMVFSLTLRWLPVVGAETPAHLVLPTVALALPTAAVIARLVRACMLDVSASDFVRTAYAKGLDGVTVWRRHILRNGLVPVITLLGLNLAHMLGGAFIVETIFGWPGLGRLVVQAIFDRDLPVVMGAVLLMAAIIQMLNLAVDLLHALLDPRVGASALT